MRSISRFPDGKLPATWNPQELAERLKRRIDPADLYNVTIRPVSDTRVEIILPTGGQTQIKAEEAAWRALLVDVETHWPAKHYVVPAGQRLALVAEINAQFPDEPVADINRFIDENWRSSSDAHTVGDLAAPLGAGPFQAAAHASPPRRIPKAGTSCWPGRLRSGRQRAMPLVVADSASWR